MDNNKLELPFKQLLWTLWKLRLAQRNYENLSTPATRENLRMWKDNTDKLFKTLGVDENTDFKNIQITFVDGDSSR